MPITMPLLQHRDRFVLFHAVLIIHPVSYTTFPEYLNVFMLKATHIFPHTGYWWTTFKRRFKSFGKFRCVGG